MIRLALAVALLAPAALAQELQGRMDVWDLALGQRAEEIADDFVDHSCGTNGGPPSRPIGSFAAFSTCPRDIAGLYEVYFRYNDEQEYVARALEQVDLVNRYRGTQVYGFPVIASALFDPGGVLVGIRLVTDPRDTETRRSNEFWTLGRILMQRFGEDAWICAQLPPVPGEEAIGAYFVKERCRKAVDDMLLMVERRYLQRRGQRFVDPLTGLIDARAYESWTRLEMFARDGG